jgi:hypothetical protein
MNFFGCLVFLPHASPSFVKGRIASLFYSLFYRVSSSAIKAISPDGNWDEHRGFFFNLSCGDSGAAFFTLPLERRS